MRGGLSQEGGGVRGDVRRRKEIKRECKEDEERRVHMEEGEGKVVEK